jgi:hypothetical protein
MFDSSFKSPGIIAAFSTVIAALIFLALLLVLYLLFRRALWLLLKAINFSGLPALATLLALGLSVSFFRGGAISLWTLIYGFLELLFVNFPRVLVDVAYSSYSCSSPANNIADSSCFFLGAAQFANGLKAILTQPFSNYSVSVIALIQFFASWGLLAWLFGQLIALTEGGETSILAKIKAIPAPVSTHIGLGTIIIIATYLCLCAIMAVSLFKPAEKPRELAQIEAELTKSKLSDSGKDSPFDKRFPETLPDLPDQKSGAGAFLAGTYPQLSESWRQLGAQVAVEQDRLLQRAVAAYMIENLNRVGTREEANHFLAVSRWYQSALTNLFDRLDGCRSAILQVRLAANATAVQVPSVSIRDGSSQEHAAVVEAPPASLVPASTVSPSGTPGSSIFGGSNADLAVNEANRTCSRRPDIEDPPDRGDFGYTLGIAGHLSSWLLRSESMPLALIAGLVGFGLLGALVSRFVRAPTDQPTTLDFFGVVSRGASAAVLVFLAAYGGLAIVSETTANPNPYVVFLTCLVGSVFADDVWSWGRAHMMDWIGSAQGKPPDAEKATIRQQPPSPSQAGSREAERQLP